MLTLSCVCSGGNRAGCHLVDLRPLSVQATSPHPHLRLGEGHRPLPHARPPPFVSFGLLESRSGPEAVRRAGVTLLRFLCLSPS